MSEETQNAQEVSAVIILGARNFPSLGVESLPALENSAIQFRQYISRQTHSLSIDRYGVLDLFGSTAAPGSQLESIETFLAEFNTRHKSSKTKKYKNLILYYVGHGLIIGDYGRFGLAVSYTREANLLSTSLLMDGLAEVIKTNARFTRRFIILDCCFAGSAMKDWLCGESSATLNRVVSGKLKSIFSNEDAHEDLKDTPSRGTSIICAAGKDSVARASHPAGTTLFTGAMLDVLTSNGEKPRVSLQTLNDGAWRSIQSLGYSVRPIVFSPDQQEGDIAKIPIFPLRIETNDAESPPATSKKIRSKNFRFNIPVILPKLSLIIRSKMTRKLGVLAVLILGLTGGYFLVKPSASSIKDFITNAAAIINYNISEFFTKKDTIDKSVVDFRKWAAVDRTSTVPAPNTDNLKKSEPSPNAFDVKWLATIYFNYDRSDINLEGEKTLQTVSQWMKANKDATIILEGYSAKEPNPDGTEIGDSYQQKISERRANSVKRVLTVLGVPSSRMSTVGYGVSRVPWNADGTVASARRVDIRQAENK